MTGMAAVMARFGAGFRRGMLAVVVIAVCAGGVVRAQDAKLADAAKAIGPTYRLTYTLTESDGGKRIGVQHFALTLNANLTGTGYTNPYADLKLGSRVPYTTGLSNGSPAQVQYVDIGLSIRASMTSDANGFLLNSKVEQSSVAESPKTDALLPVVRQSVLANTALLTVGKPVMIGSLDTPGSTRHLDVEVVLEPLR